MARVLCILGLFILTESALAYEILDTLWVGDEPKTYTNGQMVCPDLETRQPKLKPYLRVQAYGEDGFRIFEADNCYGIFSFDGDTHKSYTDPAQLTEGYFFYYHDGLVYDRLNQKVGTIGNRRIELFGGGFGGTRFKHVLLEILPNGHLRFYARFSVEGFHKAVIYEHLADFLPSFKKNAGER